MRIYLAEIAGGPLFDIKITGIRMLVSYYYHSAGDFNNVPTSDIMADSGAFSAHTQNAEINIREYAEWLLKWKHRFTGYFNLDVIGDPVKSRINQEWLERQGLTPLPVYHIGSPFNYLEEMIEKYRYIAIGGIVAARSVIKRVMPHLIRCFRLAEGRAVYHGLGTTSLVLIKSFPWHSVDSSRWSSGFRYGVVVIFDEVAGRFIALRLGDIAMCKRHSSLIARFGFNPMDFADRARYDRRKAAAISALSYMKAEEWMTRRWR